MNPDQAADQAQQAADQAQQAVEDAAPQLQETAEQAADTAQSTALWTFAGLLIGAVIAALAGLFGSRSVSRDRTDETGGQHQDKRR